MSGYVVRLECPGDEAAIARITTRAFAQAEHSDGTEAAIIDRLRAKRALALSLVADNAGRIVGHAAFSPVAIGHGGANWFGLGPVAVAPESQRRGIGGAMIEHGLTLLRATGAHGVVVLGDPAFYAKFGFARDPALTFPSAPPEYFQRLVLAGEPPTGIVCYNAAFD